MCRNNRESSGSMRTEVVNFHTTATYTNYYAADAIADNKRRSGTSSIVRTIARKTRYVQTSTTCRQRRRLRGPSTTVPRRRLLRCRGENKIRDEGTGTPPPMRPRAKYAVVLLPVFSTANITVAPVGVSCARIAAPFATTSQGFDGRSSAFARNVWKRDKMLSLMSGWKRMRRPRTKGGRRKILTE